MSSRNCAVSVTFPACNSRKPTGFSQFQVGNSADPAGSRANPVGSSEKPAGICPEPAGVRRAPVGNRWEPASHSRFQGSFPSPRVSNRTAPQQCMNCLGMFPRRREVCKWQHHNFQIETICTQFRSCFFSSLRIRSTSPSVPSSNSVIGE